MTWETTQSGIVRFSLKCDMATHSIWRSAGTLEPSVFLFYTILSALVYRSVKPVALIAYSKKVHQYHDWLLDQDGTSISHFYTVWRPELFQFHPCLFVILQRVWTVKLLSTLVRIQRSRVLYTYGLGIHDGGRNDANSNKLSPSGAVIQANVCAMNACKIQTSK